jgi:hypothetical protein
MRGPVTKTCEQCKQTFECGGYQCWCGKVGITEQQMDWITARFQDCLCPACLKMVSTGEFEGFPVKPVSPAGAE